MTNLFKLALLAFVGIANAESNATNNSLDEWRLTGEDGWSNRFLNAGSIRAIPEGIAYLIRYTPKDSRYQSTDRSVVTDCSARKRFEIVNSRDWMNIEPNTVYAGTVLAKELDAACQIAIEEKIIVAPAARQEATSDKTVAAKTVAPPPSNREVPAELTPNTVTNGPTIADSKYQSKETDVCLLQLLTDAKVKPLIGKVAFDLDKPQGLEMLANPSKSTPKEKTALSYYSTEWQRCQDLGADWRKRTLGPDIDALFSALKVDLTSGLADLYIGQISFGTAAKMRARQWVDFMNGAELIERRTSTQTAENERQRQIQAQREAAAAQERAAQERSRQQVEANQRRALELQQQQLMEQRQALEQRAAALKKEQSDREWNEAIKRYQSTPAQSPDRRPINCTTTTNAFGVSNTNCY